MELHPDVIPFVAGTAEADAVAAPQTISGGASDYYPQPLTKVYTSGFAIAHIRMPGAAQRIIYALCEARRTRIVEFKAVNGVLVPYPPPELAADNTIDGLSVNPQFLWIDVADGRQQLRLYVVAESEDKKTWLLRFVWPDLPIYRVRQ